jgi:hypothetical protein
MTQYVVIGAAVLWALLYSGWSLMPAGWRRSLARRLGGWAARSRLGRERARSLESTLLRTGGCSACDSCKGCAPRAGNAPPHEPFL